MAFHSPGHENQSKNGSNPYAKDGAASATSKGGASQAPRPGQKPARGKKGKGPKQTPKQGGAQQVAAQGQQGQAANASQQSAGAQKQGAAQGQQVQKGQAAKKDQQVGKNGVAAGNQGAEKKGAAVAGGKDKQDSKGAKNAKDAKKVAVVRKKGFGGGARDGRDGRVYEERSVMHVDPMSALKVGFLLSACLFLVWIVAAVVIYVGLAMAGVWDKINGLIGDLMGSGEFGFGAYFGIVFGLGLMELVVLTLLAPVAAMAYNASAALIGGLRIKLDN